MDDLTTSYNKTSEDAIVGQSADISDTAADYDNPTFEGFGSFQRDSEFVSLLKGILGAFIGALPGIMLMILLSRYGLIASICGTVMAVGTIYGYNFMTRNSFLDFKYCIIVCIAVMLLWIYLAVRISWAWKFSVLFPELYEQSYDIWQRNFTANGFTAEQADKYFNAFFDNPDKGFLAYFIDFGDYLEYPGLKLGFGLSLFENYIFAAIGSAVVFKKLI